MGRSAAKSKSHASPRRKRRPTLFALWDGFIVGGGLFAVACAGFAIIFRTAATDGEPIPISQLVIAGLTITGLIAGTAGFLFGVARHKALKAQAALESLAARHEVALNAIPGAVIETDGMDGAVYASAAIDQLTGFPRDRFENGKTTLGDLMEPAARKLRDTERTASLAETNAYAVRYALTCLDGTQRLIEETGVTDPERSAEAAFLRDITHTQSIVDACSTAENRFRLAATTLSHALLEFDRDGVVCFANDACRILFDTESGPMGLRFIDLGWDQTVHERVEADLKRLVVDGYPPIPSVSRIRRRDGTFADVRLDWGAMRDGDGRIDGGMVVVTDITELYRLESAVTSITNTDSVTGAFNRRRFMEQAETEFRRAKRFSSSCALLSVRLDGLDQAVDGDGSSLGDPYLASFADVCWTRLRDVDVLGRTGPDVMSVILPEAGSRTILSIADRLRRAACELVVAGNQACVRSTVSIGVAKLQHSDEDVRALVERAEQSAEHAHKQGGNRVLMG